jgi:hypothetical protein
LRRIHGQSNPISHNLIITGFGFILGLIASSPAVHLIDKVHTPFPPFAVVPWAFVGFAAYLVSLGFFLSATTISQDAKLRKSVRQLATEESSKMLYSMGTAHMEQTIRTRVQSIAKEQEESLKKETGVQNVVSQEDVEAYVNDVIDELKKKRS